MAGEIESSSGPCFIFRVIKSSTKSKGGGSGAGEGGFKKKKNISWRSIRRGVGRGRVVVVGEGEKLAFLITLHCFNNSINPQTLCLAFATDTDGRRGEREGGGG